MTTGEPMSAWLLDGPGSPADLRRGRIARPTPARGDVLVRVEAVGLNPVDTKLMARGNPSWSWPHVPGIDFAGVVEGLGPGVADGLPDGSTAPRVGDRVAAHGFLQRDGALADFVVADALTIAVVPEGLDATVAAALPCAGMTAYQSVVDRLHVDECDTVLVQGGGGAVGGFAVQLAAQAGARVIATASARDHDRVRALGAADLVDHHLDDVVSRVLELTSGRGVDGIVDVMPAPSATRNLSLLAFGGGIACVGGMADTTAVAGSPSAPSVHRIALGAAHASGDMRARRRLSTMLTALMEAASASRLDPLLERVVDIDDAPAALDDVASGRARGKLVVRMQR